MTLKEKILAACADGRERTLEDIRIRVCAKIDEVNAKCTQLAKAGHLTRREIKVDRSSPIMTFTRAAQLEGKGC